MRLKIIQSKLKEGIGIVERISSRATSLPILKNIMIKAEKNLIGMSATDLEVGIQWWGLAKVEKEGEVIVPASILSSFIGFLPDKTVDLSTSKNDLEMECGDYKTQIKGFDPNDFPIIPKVLEKESVVIGVSEICKGLSQVVDIPSFSTTRPEISGVLFSFINDEVKMVATDSYRLGEKRLKLKQPIKEPFSFILPQKAVKEMISIFGDKEGDLKVMFSTNQVLFELPMEEIPHPRIHFSSRQVEGDYPNYEEIIPQKNKIKAVLKRSDLINQIKAAGLFSGKVGEVVFKVDPDKKGIEILSQSPEAGEYNSFISGKIDGKKEKISFNYRYLIDGLSKMTDSEIVFEINGSGDPGVFKSLEESNFIYIVMPIKA